MVVLRTVDSGRTDSKFACADSECNSRSEFLEAPFLVGGSEREEEGLGNRR